MCTSDEMGFVYLNGSWPHETWPRWPIWEFRLRENFGAEEMAPFIQRVGRGIQIRGARQVDRCLSGRAPRNRTRRGLFVRLSGPALTVERMIDLAASPYGRFVPLGST
jgi:hypothetical protein